MLAGIEFYRQPIHSLIWLAADFQLAAIEPQLNRVLQVH